MRAYSTFLCLRPPEADLDEVPTADAFYFPKKMTSTVTLTRPLLRTYNTIVQHPVAHILEWHHVHALFRSGIERA